MISKEARSAIGKNNKLRSRAFERDWARHFGAQRNPDTGKAEADVFLGPFDLEVKSREGMVELLALMDEAKAKAREGQIPVLGLTLRNGRRLRHLLMVEREAVDSLQWYEEDFGGDGPWPCWSFSSPP